MSEVADEKLRETSAVPTAEARAAVLDALLMIDAPPISPAEPAAIPADAKPAEAKTAEIKATGATSILKSLRAKSAEAKSAKAQSAEAKLAGARPAEAKPAESRLPETKAPETAPSSAKPSEAPSGDTPAAEAKQAAEEQSVVPEPSPASKRFRDSASTQITAARERIAQRNLSGAMTIALAVGVLSAGVAGGTGYLAGLSEKTATHTQALQLSVLRIEAEMATLRSEMERATRAIAAAAEESGERLQRIEIAQAEPLAKLNKLAEMIEKLRNAQASMLAAVKQESSEVTGAVVPPQSGKSRPSNVVVAAWVLREFDKDVALIEGKRGLLEITVGDDVPGAGRVEGFRRHEGRWAVVTRRGLITSR